MTLTVGLAVFAVCCSIVGLAGVAADWWLQRRQPPGRHRARPEAVGFSATANLRALRADTDRLPPIPHPTREQLRQEAGTR